MIDKRITVRLSIPLYEQLVKMAAEDFQKPGTFIKSLLIKETKRRQK